MVFDTQSSLHLTGCVFDIQRYSLHDGPGIRTLVFLKGCPLRCKWCSNPESQNEKPELAYNPNKCIGVDHCGRCTRACLQTATGTREGHNIITDQQRCEECFHCVEACPAKARYTFGAMMSVNEVLDLVEADAPFYARSGGGMTLSGGEPLFQGKFSYELLREAKRRRIKTAMETCGFAKWEDLAKMGHFLDAIFYDVKCINPDKHQQFTGYRNDLILDNFSKLCDNFPALPKVVRTPVIPGFNDTEEDIINIAKWIKGKPNVSYELLPFHRLGEQKYHFLRRRYLMNCVALDAERVNSLKKLVSAAESDLTALKAPSGK